MLHRLIRIKCVADGFTNKYAEDNNIATDKKAVIPTTGPEGYFSFVTAVHRVTVNQRQTEAEEIE